jgi:hypothetical protein
MKTSRLLALFTIVGVIASSNSLSAQGVEGSVFPDGPCGDGTILWADFDVAWPGSVCQGDLDVIDYFAAGPEGMAQLNTARTLHCPMMSQFKRITWEDVCDGGDFNFVEQVSRFIPNNRFMIRVNNQTGVENGVACTVTRRVINRATGQTTFEDSETEFTTGAGFQTLFFNDMPSVTDTIKDRSELFPYFHAVCQFEGDDEFSGVLMLWAGASI